jgi:hypothetical protein
MDKMIVGVNPALAVAVDALWSDGFDVTADNVARFDELSTYPSVDYLLAIAFPPETSDMMRDEIDAAERPARQRELEAKRAYEDVQRECARIRSEARRAIMLRYAENVDEVTYPPAHWSTP